MSPMSTVPSAPKREFMEKQASRMTQGRKAAKSATRPNPAIVKSLPKGAPAPTPSLACHAANRIMYGPRQGDIQAIEAQGYEPFVEEQLYPEYINDSVCDAKLAELQLVTLGENRTQAFDRRNNSSYNESVRPVYEARHATIVRVVWSKRQLFERMVDFWHNHFNVYAWDYSLRSLWMDWDKTLRQHALGNFRELLEATTTHPNMLYYLDNYISTNAGPNENYARELMELHTLGAMNYQVEGGYIDQDVYEASRCFTGWTFEQNGSRATRGEFKYNHDQHDRFIKYFFGNLLPGDQPPLMDGKFVLDQVAFHRGTAKHIAWKLCRRFVADNPPEALVMAVADVFYNERNAPDQIRRVMNFLLKHDTFKTNRMNKFKRPLDFVGSAMRTLGMEYTTEDPFWWLYDDLGTSLFSWRTPDGPPDEQSYWMTSNSFLRRWNWASQIASGWYEDRGLIFTTPLPPGMQTAREIGIRWAWAVHQRSISQVSLDAIIDFIADGRGWDSPMPADDRDDKSHFSVALCLMTPEFMRR